MMRDVKMESRSKSNREKIPSKLDSIGVNINSENVSLLSVSQEERKREASKPLYLTRYE
jgi:hypothetical protein